MQSLWSGWRCLRQLSLRCRAHCTVLMHVCLQLSCVLDLCIIKGFCVLLPPPPLGLSGPAPSCVYGMSSVLPLEGAGSQAPAVAVHLLPMGSSVVDFGALPAATARRSYLQWYQDLPVCLGICLTSVSCFPRMPFPPRGVSKPSLESGVSSLETAPVCASMETSNSAGWTVFCFQWDHGEEADSSARWPLLSHSDDVREERWDLLDPSQRRRTVLLKPERCGRAASLLAGYELDC